MAEEREALGETDSGGRLALPQRRRGDGRDDDVAGAGAPGQVGHRGEVDLGDVPPVGLEAFLRYAGGLGDRGDGLEVGGPRDGEV